MQTKETDSSISVVTEEIEIPDSAYDRAESRYEDLGEWLGRPESTLHDNDPEVFPQGSFLLGTVTQPPNADGEYDLDLAVKLRSGVSKETHTQKQLKKMVGEELERYRQARGIQEGLDEKRRCWRLEYQDELSFHMDIVPCIPEDERQRRRIKEAMLSADTDEPLAEEVANLTVSITDTERPDYETITKDWNVSNPQGYGRWFESRVRLVKKKALMTEKRAEVEEIPTYKLKAPLQQCVQLLKLHRDIMFEENPNCEPISVIITTLAARTYEGQEDVRDSLLHAVNTMGSHVNDSKPKVPNPVDPEEDFADKWYTREGRSLRLEENFWEWLQQAKTDFRRIVEMQDPDELAKLAEKSLGVRLDTESVRERFGESIAASTAASTSKSPNSSSKTRIQTPPKLWAMKKH